MAAVKSRRIEGVGTTDAQWAASTALQGVAQTGLAELVPPGARAVIVAPHPDDEILGCGGLMRRLAAAGHAILLLAVTDGGGSHPGSTAWPVDRLTAARREETREALARLGVSDQVTVRRLGFTDGGLGAEAMALTDALRAAVEPRDVVFATWEHDGHPDHEVVGRCARDVAAARGARLVQVPIWAWHWATPEDPRMPWTTARRLPLGEPDLAAKECALNAFTSQITPDPSTGRAPILPAWALARMLRPFEVYFP